MKTLNIGERITALLDEKNIPLTDFAALLGVFEEIIIEWTRGTICPTLSQVVKISEYLNVSTEYLLKGETLKEVTAICPHCNKKIKLKIL